MRAQRKLIEQMLGNTDNVRRYEGRRQQFPIIAELTPEHAADVVTSNPPWYCQGLAWRMAMWHDDASLVRLEELLSLAKQSAHWQHEWKNNWRSDSLAGYDRFYHLFWMLQCLEYLGESNADVRFIASRGPAPDLEVTTPDRRKFYVECYVFSKWWFVEQFLEDLVRATGPDLELKRILNIPYQGLGSPIRQAEHIDSFANILQDHVKLAGARIEARSHWPVEIHRRGNWRLLVRGSDTANYVPGSNAHGDPSASFEAFLVEIVNAKAGKNGLDSGSYHPHLVMANGLGTDFQLGFGVSCLKQMEEVDLRSLCGLLVARCGIGARLREQPWLCRTCGCNHPANTLFRE